MKRYQLLLTLLFLAITAIVSLRLTNTTNAYGTSFVSDKNSNKLNYRLVWTDDFNGNKLDETKWTKIKRIKNIAWCAHMSDEPLLYRLKNGFLRIYCRENTWLTNDTATVLTGGITSKGKYEMGFGKFEIRARMTSATGCWPAIWLSSTTTASTNIYERAELDLVEHYNHESNIQHTVHNHYIDIQKKQKREEFNKFVDIDVSRWNTYTVEVLPSQVRFRVNGITTFTYNKLNDPTILGQWPYGKTKCAILIDMQWGNRWLRELRVDELPCWMDIDWVKIYDLI